jgi:hypothetical protein
VTDNDWEDAGLRLTEAICRARKQQVENRVATFFADPRWPALRPHVECLLGVSLTPLDELVARVRRETWRDFSGS